MTTGPIEIADPALTHADVRRIRTVLAAAERNGHTWLGRHQAIALALVGALVGGVSWAVGQWSRDTVLEIQQPVDEAQDARAAELSRSLADEAALRERDAARLRQNDVDLVDYLRESDRYDRAVLETIAKKLRVRDSDLPDREPLDQAAERLDAIKSRGRLR